MLYLTVSPIYIKFIYVISVDELVSKGANAPMLIGNTFRKTLVLRRHEFAALMSKASTGLQNPFGKEPLVEILSLALTLLRSQ